MLILRPRFFFITLGIFLSISLARAWDNHPSLMPYILQDLSSEERQELEQPVKPDAKKDEAFYLKLTKELMFNPKIKLLPLQANKVRDVLLSIATDEPDYGIDNDIEDPNADPRGDRDFMGGTQGPTSRGFRHMYFGGWKLVRPLKTFQIPTRALGQAPERAEILAEKARALIKSGEFYWGYRLLAWSMHLLQDLAQPFHAVQVPSVRMPTWGVLFLWPIQDPFGKLVKETTRTISNYHYAYEAYVYRRLTQKEQNPIKDCLQNVHALTKFRFSLTQDTPLKLAHEVAEHSIQIAREVGTASMDFFGKELKKLEYDIPNHKGTVNYEQLATAPEFFRKRERLEQATCKALANGIVASRLLLLWGMR